VNGTDSEGRNLLCLAAGTGDEHMLLNLLKYVRQQGEAAVVSAVNAADTAGYHNVVTVTL
jgi:hypothetical protein